MHLRMRTADQMRKEERKENAKVCCSTEMLQDKSSSESFLVSDRIPESITNSRDAAIQPRSTNIYIHDPGDIIIT